MRLRAMALALAAVAAAAATHRVEAVSEHERRLGAELAVLAGDARRLAESMPESQRSGLTARIKGGLSGLPLLMRQARDSNSALPAAPQQTFAEIRAALDRQDPSRLAAALAALARTYPFDAAGILPAEATPERLRVGEAIHKETCAGCHDYPDTRGFLPAHNLFRWARTMPAAEFAARMYAGLRGDPLTGLANPFGAVDIAALIAYYREGQEGRRSSGR